MHHLLIAIVSIISMFSVSISWALASCHAVLQEYRNSVVFVKVVVKDQAGQRELSSGAGFVVTETGLIVTAGHLLPENVAGESIQVSATIGARHGHPYPIQLVARDPDSDVALFQLPQSPHGKPLLVRQLSSSEVGASLCVLGFPFTSDLTFADGAITDQRGPKGRFQMNAQLNPGFSGGPVMLESGEVVGMAWGSREGAQAMTYMVPGWLLNRVVPSTPPPPPPPPKIELQVSAPRSNARDLIYPIQLRYPAQLTTGSSVSAQRSMWLVAQDEGGFVWAQRQVRQTQPRFNWEVAKDSGFPLTLFVIAVDQTASREIQRHLDPIKPINLDDLDHQIVSNIYVAEKE